MGVNSGLIPIVIVIVIGSLFGATFFSQKWHPVFGLLGYNIIDDRHTRCFHPAFALPSLCLRSKSGGKVYPT